MSGMFGQSTVNNAPLLSCLSSERLEDHENNQCKKNQPNDYPGIDSLHRNSALRSFSTMTARLSPYSAIVSDIDGTLISSVDKTFSDRLKSAVQGVIQSGFKFSLATGKPLYSAWKCHQQIAANGPLICYQGAMAVEAETGDILRHERLDEDAAEAAISFFEKRGFQTRVYIDDTVWVSKLDDDYVAYVKRNNSKIGLEPDLKILAKQLPILVLGIAEPTVVSKHVTDIDELTGETALVTRSLPRFCEVGSPNAGKANALQWLADREGIKSDDFVAFGDDLGDAEMLSWAGLGIAVETGNPSVIAAADETVPGPDDDGVAKKLESLTGTC